MQDHNKDEIDLQQLLRILSEYKLLIFSKKNKILFITFLFTLIGYVFTTFFWDEEYKADLTFVVEEEAGAMGGLSSAIGIASQFGFDLGTGSGSTFSQNNIIELLKSRQAIASVLLKEKKIGKEETLLIEHYLKINNLWNDLVIDNPNITNFQDNITQDHDSIINLVWQEIIDNRISVNMSSEDANIIQLSYVSVNQEFAKFMVEELIVKMSKMYIEYQTSQANNTINFLADRSDSVFYELELAEKEYARTKDINQRIIKSSGRIKELQLLRDVEVLNAMYMEIVKNLEISKLTLLNNTPIINIIDKPVLPLEQNNLTFKLILLIFAFLGFFLTSFYYIFKKIYKDTVKI